MTGGSVEVAVADTSIAEVTAEIKDGKLSYVLEGKKSGYTTAEIAAKDARKVKGTGIVRIFVNREARIGGENIVYDFRKGNTGDNVNLVYSYVAGLTYEDTATGGASEKNPQLYSAPWQQLKFNNITGIRSFIPLYEPLPVYGHPLLCGRLQPLL